MANKKISKVNLSGESYEIDVATNLKATNILSSDKGQTSKVATVGAVQKPDGVNALFDENNKISSSYLSDTILGQLKFGGSLYLGSDDPTGTANSIRLSILPSAALNGAFEEYLKTLENFNSSWIVMEPGLKFYIQAGYNYDYMRECSEWYFSLPYGPEGQGNPELNVKFPTSICEGYYFIAGTDLSGAYYSEKYASLASSYSEDYSTVVLDESQVGDWQVVSNGKLIKIDNTDTITHIKDSYTSLLSIEGAGLKLKGFTDAGQSIKFDKPLTYEVGSTKLSLGANGVNGLYIGDQSYINSAEVSAPSVKASTKMTAPTITNTADKTQVVNLDYFENNATKVDWENIDSEVHVINDHNVEIDGGLTVGKSFVVETITASTEDISSSCHTTKFDDEGGTWGGWEPLIDCSGWERDTYYQAPYWLYFPVKTGCCYQLNLVKGSAQLYYKDKALLMPDHVKDAPLHATEILSYNMSVNPDDSDKIDESFSFKSDITGYAAIAYSPGTPIDWTNDDHSFSVIELVESQADVKINGDLEVTGDLSFGADSHIVFGTIEGTDFIADYAKVKNAPVEDDDVVNKAYFDANKGSGGGSLPSGATEGAFLRYKSGAAVWEVIPSAEDSAF